MPVAACQLVLLTAAEGRALVGTDLFASSLPLAASGVPPSVFVGSPSPNLNATCLSSRHGPQPGLSTTALRGTSLGRCAPFAARLPPYLVRPRMAAGPGRTRLLWCANLSGMPPVRFSTWEWALPDLSWQTHTGPGEPIATAAGVLGIMAIWRCFYAAFLDYFNFLQWTGGRANLNRFQV